MTRRGVVYVVSNETTGPVSQQNTFLFALNAKTGTQIWSYQIEDLVNANPAVSGDIVAIGTKNGVAGLGLKDGSELWKYESDSLVAVEHVMITSGQVIGGGPQGLFALDAGTGALLWDSKSYDATKRNELGYPPASGKGMAFETVPDNILRAQDLKDGSVKWTFEGSTGAPSIVDDKILTPVEAGLSVLDIASGKLLLNTSFTFNGEAADAASSPLIVDGIVYVTLAVKSTAYLSLVG